ncbi:hypothetical protein ED562_14230 [Microcystis aeruginosa FACHB-524]|nr:hypothetical protein ED562_14230 [Microcystis aeruginosa FACHB-524]
MTHGVNSRWFSTALDLFLFSYFFICRFSTELCLKITGDRFPRSKKAIVATSEMGKNSLLPAQDLFLFNYSHPFLMSNNFVD